MKYRKQDSKVFDIANLDNLNILTTDEDIEGDMSHAKEIHKLSE